MVYAFGSMGVRLARPARQLEDWKTSLGQISRGIFLNDANGCVGNAKNGIVYIKNEVSIVWNHFVQNLMHVHAKKSYM